MPELPEVETVRRGLAPHLVGRELAGAVVREPRLRWPVPADLDARLQSRTVEAVRRRGKYLLLELCGGGQGGLSWLMIHLGMSGSLRLAPEDQPPRRHDHVDVLLDGTPASALRLHDPRRFGSMHCFDTPPGEHPLLRELGPEPLEAGFDGGYLHRRSRGRRAPVKAFLMDHRVVAGIGNIYANEALFRAGVRPDRAAGRVGRARYQRLATAIAGVLNEAIDAGGTSLRDFVDGSGAPGYFAVRLDAYGGSECPRCGGDLRKAVIAQRSSFFCPRCQR